MPLVTRLQNIPGTIAEMERAALSRYEDGRRLLTAGRRDGGIYLLGYSAEILLKTAISRVGGVPRNTSVMVRLSTVYMAYKGGRTSPPFVRPYGHDLLALESLLLYERSANLLLPLPTVTAQLLSRSVSRLAGNWYVEMRYRHRGVATIVEASEVLANVTWLKQNYTVLWR